MRSPFAAELSKPSPADGIVPASFAKPTFPAGKKRKKKIEKQSSRPGSGRVRGTSITTNLLLRDENAVCLARGSASPRHGLQIPFQFLSQDVQADFGEQGLVFSLVLVPLARKQRLQQMEQIESFAAKFQEG